MLLLLLLITGVAAMYCLLGVWAAVGKPHWFIRVGILLGALALLVPIRAYEPLILFGMTAAMLIAGWSLWRWAKPSQHTAASPPPAIGRYSFRLADLLLGCVVAGVASWMASVIQAKGVEISWWRAFVTALVIAVLPSLAVNVVAGQQRWRFAGLLVLAILTASAVESLVTKHWTFGMQMLGLIENPPTPPLPLRYALIGNSILYGVFSIWLLALAIGGQCWRVVWQWRRTGHFARGLTVALGVPAVLFLGWIYWRMLEVKQVRLSDPASENVLPRIRALGRAATPLASSEEKEAIIAELLTLLDRPCFVVWPKDRRTYTQSGALEQESVLVRNLARYLMPRADALAAEGEFDAATDESIAILRLGEMADREGVIEHRIDSEALFHMAYCSLAKRRQQLSPEKATETAMFVTALSARREPVETTIERDRVWHERHTWRDLLKRVVFGELQGIDLGEAIENTLESFVPREQCFARLLALDLLIRAHRAEHGQWPQTLAEVVPAEHPELLEDPLSEQPFVYRPAEPEFVLYSIGADGIDEGGNFTSMMKYGNGRRQYDLDLETLIRP